MLLLVAATPASAQSIGAWSFEEGVANAAATGAGSVLDSVGTADGTPASEPTYRADTPALLPNGDPNSALSIEFFGTGEYVEVPSQFLFNTPGDATLELWIKTPPGGFTSHQAILWGRADSIDVDRFHLSCFQTSNALSLDYRSADSSLHQLIGPGGSGPTLVADAWNHVAVVRSGNTYSMFTGC
jgi:hypothetical protein